MNKKIYGIDTLYFFFETNENYDDLFLEILDQLEDIKGKFLKKDIEFENKDLYINLKDMQLNFLGKQEGFYWFKDSNDFFRIGFKDKYKNRGLNDIRVQLQGNGIYTFGISSIIKLLQELLNDYITSYVPVTRVDINCFVQYDLSFIKKDMFVTRKRKYSTINEIGDANNTQTIYIGKEPFKLRIYNKSLELKKSKKFEIMNEYFLNHNFNLEETIFNIEFELHRTHLKQFNINSLDELFANLKNLFISSMNEIKLIDINSISNSNLVNNKYQATIHPLWDEIINDFNIDEFIQNSIPIERLKRKISIYNESKFEFEYIALIRKAYINNLTLDTSYLDELYFKAKDSLKKTTTNKQIKKDYIEVDVIHESTNIKEEFRLFKDGTLIKPLRTETVANLNDYELLVYLDKTSEKQHLSDRDNHIYQVAYKEAQKRNLLLNISSKEAMQF